MQDEVEKGANVGRETTEKVLSQFLLLKEHKKDFQPKPITFIEIKMNLMKDT